MKDDYIENITYIHYYDHTKIRIDFKSDYYMQYRLPTCPTMDDLIDLLKCMNDKYKYDTKDNK